MFLIYSDNNNSGKHSFKNISLPILLYLPYIT